MTEFESELTARAKLEVRELPVLQYKNTARIKKLLEKLFKIAVWNFGQENERKLLTLKVWEEKYGVTIGYILETLVPHYQERFRQRRRSDGRRGMPCSVPTLTGKVSEQLLKKQIELDFPDQEHLELRRQIQRELLLAEQEDVEYQRRKNITDYEWPSAFVQSYEHRIREARRHRDRARQERQKPYRGNPWI